MHGHASTEPCAVDLASGALLGGPRSPAASHGDPVADHLRRLGRTRGAHVVDAGESSVASYVTYAEYLPTGGRKHRVLIVARDEELGKWVAAFSGKPYYRGDFDACPNFAEYDYGEAEPLDVYVCSGKRYNF